MTAQPVTVNVTIDSNRLARIVTERGRSGALSGSEAAGSVTSASTSVAVTTSHAPADPGWELWAAIQADEIDARQSRSRRRALAFSL